MLRHQKSSKIRLVDSRFRNKWRGWWLRLQNKNLINLLINLERDLQLVTIKISSYALFRFVMMYLKQSRINRALKKLNEERSKIAMLKGNTFLIEFYLFPSRAHSRYGQHIKRKGKAFLAKKILPINYLA